MTDRLTANLPARSFDETSRFFEKIGFAVQFRDEGWMIMSAGPLEIEFFPHPDLDPKTSWFSACVRVADVDALHDRWSRALAGYEAHFRITPPADQAFGLRMFALIDPNGSLLRCLGPSADAPLGNHRSRLSLAQQRAGSGRPGLQAFLIR